MQSFEDYYQLLVNKYPSISLIYFQSNVEGEIINELQRIGNDVHGIILNPGGYTHTSVAIGDTIAAISAKVIEVHISNIFAREEFRKLSYVSAKAKAVMSGFGLRGYELALQYFID
jgi:3-dehydroquinate dehydratase-2